MIRRRSDLSSTSSSETLSPKRYKTSGIIMDNTFKEELDSYLKEQLDHFRESLVESIHALFDKRISALEKRVDKVEADNTTLNKKIADLEKAATEVRQHAVNNEQYSRRNNIRILGLPEEKGEKCLLTVFPWIRDTLHCDIKAEDIEAVHRLNGGSPRQIIVRFVSRQVRDKVIANRPRT